MLLVLFVARWTTKQQAPDTPITEDTLQQSIADLLTIHALLPRLPSTPSTPNFLPVLLRASAILYIPYLILTHLVKLRVLIALSGTVVLTWRARWAGLIRRGLWRSAYIRWGTYRLWAFLSGQPLPPPTLSPQSQLVFTSSSSLSSPTSPTSASSTNLESKDPKVGKEPIVNSFRFLFTVHENQRWWMGLDFSAALLPNERPSWSSTSHQAVAPPSMFSLPSPTTIYMNQPSSQGGGKHVQIRVKRMARWKWEEPEWKVVVHRDGASGISRVERPIPSPESENSGSTGPANRILKAAGKMRQASLSGGAAHTRAASGASIGTGVGREGSPERHRDDVFSGDGVNGNSGGKEQGLENVFTDVDGWIYGDNKWENCSSENGMGKVSDSTTPVLLLSVNIDQ